MTTTISFTLDDYGAAFVETQVAEGRHGNASDVLHAALRLLQDQQARLATLRAALLEGEESGPSTAFDFDAFIAGKQWAGKAARPSLDLFGS
ncbi:type II toxin-antitoxin system ParD family antitoxin [Labrys wisconsinensis]|uniref:Antitoxin ParD1/3/4 n=1 Tax=Labrys wisconsinensis TaxID=425677 RepID=A0ABU0JGL8_9HYPH|nr:type II toxin-antitoxin system ParD family antitoxin [Labrys wisconsinensis]MDQ0473439.1 antitoxin ParD1/3/4 [Labrys wisconsinensis]